MGVGVGPGTFQHICKMTNPRITVYKGFMSANQKFTSLYALETEYSLNHIRYWELSKLLTFLK